MIEKSTPKTSTVVISLSIDAELLRRLDVRATVEDRTRSNMVARMIDYYLYPTAANLPDQSGLKER